MNLELAALKNSIRELLDVLNEHEINTRDCNRSGEEYCDCLDRAKKKVEAVLEKS